MVAVFRMYGMGLVAVFIMYAIVFRMYAMFVVAVFRMY